MNREEVYRPLRERTLENHMVQYMARRYDFGKESRVAHLIVNEVNARMDQAEGLLGLSRARPFELSIKRGQKHVALPLFRPEYLGPILAGGTFAEAREIVLDNCLRRLREASPKCREDDVLSVINPWALVRGKGPGRYVDNLQDSISPLNSEDLAAWQTEIANIRPDLPTTRLGTFDMNAPRSVVNELVDFAVTEAGLGNVVARRLIEELITLRNICCPLARQLRSGEMPLLATHVDANLSEEVATRFRRHAPVILTVWTPEEMKVPARDVPTCLSLLKRRIVRVCFEAYRQNGLLTLMDLQWIFQISTARVSELIRSFQKEHSIIVPTPGTVLDAGRSMTHKDIIVNLHLEGHNVKKIARITHHSPRAVDNYIGTFEAVLILYLYGVPPRLMARLLRKGITLIREHLELAKRVYPSEASIREYLLEQGVTV